MDHFIRECVCFFHDKQLRGHLFLFFCIQFLKHHVSIGLQHALTSTIEKKIALTRNACFRPPITFKFHNLHVSDITRIVGEIASYHERD